MNSVSQPWYVNRPGWTPGFAIVSKTPLMKREERIMRAKFFNEKLKREVDWMNTLKRSRIEVEFKRRQTSSQGSQSVANLQPLEMVETKAEEYGLSSVSLNKDKVHNQ